MGALAIYALAFGLVQGTIIFERVELIGNPDYYSGNVSISNFNGRTGLNLDIIMYKAWGMRIMFRLNLFSVQGNKQRLMLALPKLSYCDIMRTSASAPIIIPVMKNLEKFGNLSMTCPIRKSARYLRNYYIDDEDMPLTKTLSSNSRYMLQLIFDDENDKVPVNIFRSKMFCKFVKNQQKRLF